MDALPSVASLARSGRVLVIAHRGDSRVAPENTLPAFESALRLGVDLVELDCWETADGVPVVFHDEHLDRTTDACSLWGGEKIPLKVKSLAELSRLDAGAWFSPQFAGARISTLAEVLDQVLPRAALMIERKGGAAATCVRLVSDHPLAARATIHSLDWKFVAECHRLAPEIVLGALGEGPLTQGQADAAAATGASIVGWNEQDLDAQGIRAAHERGLAVWAWTVDEESRARWLIEAGIDGLITNAPGVMQPVVDGVSNSRRTTR